jgi:hypothetical protein
VAQILCALLLPNFTAATASLSAATDVPVLVSDKLRY